MILTWQLSKTTVSFICHKRANGKHLVFWELNQAALSTIVSAIIIQRIGNQSLMCLKELEKRNK